MPTTLWLVAVVEHVTVPSDAALSPFMKPEKLGVIAGTVPPYVIELLEADTGEKHSDLEESVNLREGLGIDSVDVVSIVSQIERRFHIRMTHQELEKLVTVADVLDLLQSKLAEAPTSSPSISKVKSGSKFRS